MNVKRRAGWSCFSIRRQEANEAEGTVLGLSWRLHFAPVCQPLSLWATDCRWTVTGSEKWFVYFRGRLTHPVLVAAITYDISSNRKQRLKYYRQPAVLNCRTRPSLRCCWPCVRHRQGKQLDKAGMWLWGWRRGEGAESRVGIAAPSSFNRK